MDATHSSTGFFFAAFGVLFRGIFLARGRWAALGQALAC